MGKWSSYSLYLFIIFLNSSIFGQNLKPDIVGNFHEIQYGFPGEAFTVKFKPNGPMGKDWIYGGYWDQDSIRRCLAYREGGRWNHLPFSGYFANVVRDIEMYGDTLYIAGTFQNIILDKDSIKLPSTYLLKWFNDSLWTNSSWQNPGPIHGIKEMTVKGDSLLIWGGSYFNAIDSSFIYTHFMTTDGGANWQYPYSIVHPTEANPYFGAHPRIEILPNGHMLTLNNASPSASPFRGIVRWDGQSWNSYGNGLFGSTSRVFDFEFFGGDLFIGGTFSKDDFPNDPGRHIARWGGSAWHEVGGGLYGFVRDLFVYDSILYCSIGGGHDSTHLFGDASIPFFAGWDGNQWCGTPMNYVNAPASFGIIKDTLYVSFNRPTVVNGDSVGFLNYFDGDYLHGPNSICSTLGIGEEGHSIEKPSLSIYPNPTTGILNINLPKEYGDARLSLFSLSGQLVFGQSLNEKQNQLKLPASLKGLYLAVVEGDGELYTEKVLVE